MKKIMSTMVAVFTLLMTLMMCVSAAETAVVENTLADLTISMTADKTKYVADDQIHVSLTVENTSDREVYDVDLETIIPQGYRIQEGSRTTETAASLQVGERISVSAVFVQNADVEAAVTTTVKREESPKSDTPKTSDSSVAPFAFLAVAGAAVLVVLCVKMGKGSQILSIGLCCILTLGMTTATSVAADAAENTETATLTLPVEVEGTELILQGTVSLKTSSVGTEPTTSAPTDTDAESSAKEAAIAEENKRHEEELDIINMTADGHIETLEASIESLKSQYGISYVSSASYYEDRKSSIDSEIRKLSYQMMDTGLSTSKRQQIQSQINNLSEELLKIEICLNIIEMEEEIRMLESDRMAQIADENLLHEQKLADIEKEYG